MAFNLVKAIKSTHRNPANRILHLIGSSIYVTGIMLIVGYFLNFDTNPIIGLMLWLAAVSLFLIGHTFVGACMHRHYCDGTASIMLRKFKEPRDSIILTISKPESSSNLRNSLSVLILPF
jgi:hypothetical protein